MNEQVGVDITVRQRQTLRAIRAYQDEHGRPPTHRDLGRLLKVSSTNTVKCLLDVLARNGWVVVTPRVSRGLKFTPAGLAALE